MPASDYRHHARVDRVLDQIANRRGFGYGELLMYLGHEPKTWRPL